MKKRIPFICGNWKMNTTVEEGVNLAKALKEQTVSEEVEAVIAPSFLHLYPVKEVVDGSSWKLSAQDMSSEEMGAHTGEVAGEMIQGLEIPYVILGHSEARGRGQSNELLKKKLERAFALGLKPIFCIGEDESVYEEGKTISFVLNQLEESLGEISTEKWAGMLFAYEPIWAIGTGKTASAEDAQKVAKEIRQWIREKDEALGEELRILYGGSVKSDNARSILEQEDVDGLLVGGASLKAEEFGKIVGAGVFHE